MIVNGLRKAFGVHASPRLTRRPATPSTATTMSNSYFVPRKEVNEQYRPKGYVRVSL